MTTQNPQSGKEVAKQTSRFSSSFWMDRVFRPTYTRDGERQQVSEWFARVQYAGRREAVGLGTNNREEASRKAAKLYSTIRASGWDTALTEFRPDRSTPKSAATVGDFIKAVAPLLKVRERTFANYVYALRKIAIEATGARDRSNAKFSPVSHDWRDRADQIPLGKLTPHSVEAWKKEFIAAAGSHPVEAQRARRNVNSFIRNARALFSPKIVRRLDELSITLPAPLPFFGVDLERQGSTRYVSHINAGRLLEAARSELRDTDPDSYAVILLALGAGLRRSEIDGLCWTQLDFDRAEIRVLNHEHFEAKTDESEGSVFVDPSLLEQLRVLQTGSRSLFVIESRTPSRQVSGQYYRCAATFDRTLGWLRRHGVMGDKPLHTLRKEFGSIITATADIHSASRQLRHANIATTAAYYADHRRRATVSVGNMLEVKEAK